MKKSIFIMPLVILSKFATHTSLRFTKLPSRYYSTSIYSINKEFNCELTNEISSILSKNFNSNVKVTSVVKLSDPARPNIVHRLILDNHNSPLPKSVILKQFKTENLFETDKEALGRFIRDWIGLEFLNNIKLLDYRKFFGGSYDNRFILMEDLGEKHISLVDSLTQQDSNVAFAALQRFMRCIGNLHANCYDKTNDYYKLQKKINSDTVPLQDYLKAELKFKINEFVPILRQIGVQYTPIIDEEINGVIESVLAYGPFSTFIHGDICPDNVFDDPINNKMRIIDFEWSFVGSALLDGAYLAMSMPSCWCSKTIPKKLIKPLEQIYRQELIKKIPVAKNDTVYQAAYLDACAYWMLKSVLFIENILDKDILIRTGQLPEKSLWNPETNLLRPRTLTSLQTFIEITKHSNHLPHLVFMAEEILSILKDRWPDVKPLETYPAFRNQDIPEVDLTGDGIGFSDNTDI